MPDELEKSGGLEQDSADEGESDRPTVAPPFDPATYARTTQDAHTHATPPQGTAAQQAVLDMARPSVPPDPERERKTADFGTAPVIPEEAHPPDSIRSIAAKRIPSQQLPRISVPGPAYGGSAANADKSLVDPPRPPSYGALNAVDREWVQLEVATRPPPADAPHEDPVIEVSDASAHVSLDLDDIDLEEPHPGVPSDRSSLEDQAAPSLGGSLPPTSPPAPTPPPEPLVPAKSSAVPVPKVSSTPKGPPTEQEMNDRMSVGDYSGALEIAEKLLAEKPSDAIRTVAENCRSVLKQMYSTRIGPLDRVPLVAVPRDQLRWLSIDHKAGFVLSLVDGVSSLEMIIDVSGMPQLDTLRILSELVQQRIISLR